MTVLTTRLFKPSINESFLRRERLISMLENNCNKPLILLVAAAGYGKSVVVSQWLDEHKSAHCWISLEQDCNELRLFLEYFVTSVKTVYPSYLLQLSDMLTALELPPSKEIAKTLINELNDLPGELRIVVDDYHLIKNNVIHEIMDELFRFTPKKVSIIIITRHDPPVKLNTLKTYDRMYELRMADLRFTEEDISTYAQKIYSEFIADSTAKSIAEITEGWIIGISLMLSEIHNGKNVLESLEIIQGEKNQLSGFLIDEIFSNLTGIVKKGLMLTSLFDRFNLDMIEVVSVPITEEQINESFQIRDEIERFINISMFIIPLDNHHEWFRFHHLVQNYLHSQMKKAYSQETINQVYLKGSDYFASKEYFEEAITYAIEGHRLTRAIEIIADHWDNLLLRDQYGRLARWLGMLPAGTSENSPNLLIIRTTINDAHANYVEVKNNLDRLEIILEPLDMQSTHSKKLWGAYHALRSGLYYFTGKIDLIIEHADKALDLLSDVKSYFQDYTILMKAFVLQTSNKGAEAIELFKEHQAKIPQDYPLGFMRSHSFLPLIYIYQANLNSIKSSAKLVYRISEEEEAWVSHVMSSYLLGSIHYIQNDLDKVEVYIKSVADHRLGGRPNWVAHTLFFGVLTYLATGQYEKMKYATSQLTSFLKAFNMDNFDDLAYSIEVELAIHQNNLERAEEFATKTKFESIPIVFSFYFTQLTRIRLLLFKGDHQSMQSAFDLLIQYEQYGRSNHNLNFLIQVYALLALWYQQKTEFDKALEYLRKSLEIARPGFYIRTYVDLGKEMYTLLNQLSDKERADEYIIKILHAFENEKALKEPLLSEKVNRIETSHPGVPLTKKEIEILELVSRGYQNKEIADVLCVSPETVKKYLYYTYNKLDVKNRTSAVSRAVTLNLIPSVSEQS